MGGGFLASLGVRLPVGLEVFTAGPGAAGAGDTGAWEAAAADCGVAADGESGSGSNGSTGGIDFTTAATRAGAWFPETKRPAIRNRTAITGTTTQGSGGSLRPGRATSGLGGLGACTRTGRGAGTTGATAGWPPVIGKPPAANCALSNGNWRYGDLRLTSPSSQKKKPPVAAPSVRRRHQQEYLPRLRKILAEDREIVLVQIHARTGMAAEVTNHLARPATR